MPIQPMGSLTTLNILGMLYTAILRVQAFCPWMAELRKHVGSLEVLGCRPVFHGGGASAVVYFKLVEDVERVQSIVAGLPHIVGASFRRIGRNRCVGIVTSLFCPCSRLGIPNTHIESIHVEGDWLVFQLILRDKSELQEIVGRLKQYGVKHSYEKPKPFKAGLMLTTRQEAVLTHAYLNGYFRQPRPAPVSALAREFGVSTPAYTETLRRALAKLVAHTLSARGSSKLKLRIA
jgi:hypothetical protein